MATIINKIENNDLSKSHSSKKKRLSKFGKAMKDDVLKGSIIELSNDPWNTGK